MEFKDNLMRLRKSRGWSQEELGYRLNVSRQTVSKWEMGETTPEMAKLVAMADLFEVSLDDLAAVPSARTSQQGAGGRGYEYISKKKIGSVPLVHIRLKKGFRPARGIIAVGTVSVGVVSVGVLSAGVLSFGVIAAGLAVLASFAFGGLALGGIAVGFVALGGVAQGYLAVGGLASGIYAIGGAAIARDVAVGGYAEGTIAVGNTVKGTVEFFIENNFSEIDGQKFLTALDRTFPAMNRLMRGLFAGLFS